MIITIGIFLTVAAAAFVALPFVAGESPAEAAGPSARIQLERQKREAYTAIKEAEFDYRMGKLSETDFAALREKYSALALRAISALEGAQATAPRPSAGRRPIRIAFCPTCGHGVPPRANFCPACGRSLKDPQRSAIGEEQVCVVRRSLLARIYPPAPPRWPRQDWGHDAAAQPSHAHH
jgi:hypothetical protein